MQDEKRLGEIAGRLEKLTIYDVRQVARVVRAHLTSGQKGLIIEAILNIASAKEEPTPPQIRGAHPKSDKYDEELVAEIYDCRKYHLLLKTCGDLKLETGVHDANSSGVEGEVCGLLDKNGEKFILRLNKSQVNILQQTVDKYNLRVGDEVTAVCSHGLGGACVAGVLSVNGKPAKLGVARADFSSLTRIYPKKRMILSHGGNITCRMIDLFAPVAFGQRALVCAPANSGKTTLLKSVALGICANYGETEVVCLQLSARPEEVTDFSTSLDRAKHFSTSFNMPAETNRRVANLAFEYCKRRAEEGGDAVIIADGLFGSGLSDEEISGLLYCALNSEEGGSLTVIATMPEGTSGFTNVANMYLGLSKSLSSARIFPAIDICASYSGREESLLPGEELAAAHTLRSLALKGTATEDIINIFKATQDNAELTKQYKNGR